MIYLELFLAFLQVGAISFGGGYGAIAPISEVVMKHGWLTEEEFLQLIAVSESTPGPIVVNTATFVGSTQAGVLGSLAATFGAVLPSFIIVLIIAALLKNFLNYNGVKSFLSGVRPCVVGLILATSITMMLSNLFNFKTVQSKIGIDVVSVIIFLIIVTISLLWKKLKKKTPSPILMIVISGIIGICAGYIEEFIK